MTIQILDGDKVAVSQEAMQDHIVDTNNMAGHTEHDLAMVDSVYPECSDDSSSCPENEGHGCCKPNPPELEVDK